MFSASSGSAEGADGGAGKARGWGRGRCRASSIVWAIQLPFNFLSHCKHFTWLAAKFNILSPERRNNQINYGNKQMKKLTKRRKKKGEWKTIVSLEKEKLPVCFELRFALIAAKIQRKIKEKSEYEIMHCYDMICPNKKRVKYSFNCLYSFSKGMQRSQLLSEINSSNSVCVIVTHADRVY